MTLFPFYKNKLQFSGWSCSYKNGALLAKFQPGVLNPFVLICGCLLYCILMGKRRQMPMFTSPKVATRHYSILNLCVSGWRFAREFAHFNSSAIPGKRSLLSHSDSYINGEYKFLLTVLQLKEPVGRRGFPRQYSSSDDECISYFCIPWRCKNKPAVRQKLAIWSRQSQLLAQ